MSELRIGVLKKDDVKMGQPQQLGSPQPHPSPGQPEARVLERSDTHTTVEVVCSCGQRISLQCNHPARGTEARAT